MSDFVERLHEQMYSICDSKMVVSADSDNAIEAEGEAKDEYRNVRTNTRVTSKATRRRSGRSCTGTSNVQSRQGRSTTSVIKLRMVLDDLNITNEVACSDLARVDEGRRG